MTHSPGWRTAPLLFDRFELLLAQRHGIGVAVAFIDLDGFKAINDRRGHRTGDRVLVHVGERLQESVRQGDLVARIGGDEFVVIGESESELMALRLGERLTAAVNGDVDIEGTSVAVSASVGVAYVDADERAVAVADDILSRADAVMYATKRSWPGTAALDGDS